MLLERQGDNGFARKIDPVGRLRVVMVDKTPALFAGGDAAPLRDPRRGKSLVAPETEALASLILTEAGKERSAA
jgi:hypothetical protein